MYPLRSATRTIRSSSSDPLERVRTTAASRPPLAVMPPGDAPPATHRWLTGRWWLPAVAGLLVGLAGCATRGGNYPPAYYWPPYYDTYDFYYDYPGSWYYPYRSRHVRPLPPPRPEQPPHRHHPDKDDTRHGEPSHGQPERRRDAAPAPRRRQPPSGSSAPPRHRDSSSRQHDRDTDPANEPGPFRRNTSPDARRPR
jgi:hypothetical protein